MSESKDDSIHRKNGVELFNKTWDLIDKKDRNHSDDVNMIHSAHASRYHCGIAGEPINWARGEWQISRVYSLLSRGEPALFHAHETLHLCNKHGIQDFDLSFAYEALARAYSVISNFGKAKEYYEMAMESSEKIAEKGNRDYLQCELKTIKL